MENADGIFGEKLEKGRTGHFTEKNLGNSKTTVYTEMVYPSATRPGDELMNFLIQRFSRHIWLQGFAYFSTVCAVNNLDFYPTRNVNLFLSNQAHVCKTSNIYI